MKNSQTQYGYRLQHCLSEKARKIPTLFGQWCSKRNSTKALKAIVKMLVRKSTENSDTFPALYEKARKILMFFMQANFAMCVNLNNFATYQKTDGRSM